jgi:hypothetical protein
MTPLDLAACRASARKLARKTGCDWRDLLGYAAIRVVEMRRMVDLQRMPEESAIRFVRCAAKFGALAGARAMRWRGTVELPETLTARPPNTEWEVMLRETIRKIPPLTALAALEAADGASGDEQAKSWSDPASRITGWRVNARALAVARGAAGATERTEGMQVEMFRG